MPAGGVAWTNPLSWPFHQVVVAGVLIAIIVYLRGRRPAVSQSRRSSGWGAEEWRTTAFVLGLATIVLALDTPVETYARQLFWVHMVQHLLLITVAAPLLVLAAPGLRLWRGLPAGWRRPLTRAFIKHPSTRPLRRLFQWICTPAVAWILSSADLWLWHWPVMYNLTLRFHLVHHLEHATFLGFGVLFWAQVIDQPPFQVRMNQLRRAAYVFAGTVQSWGLAALLSLATVPFYAYAALSSRPGGISPLTDQQIGGGIMWVPGAITSFIVFCACLFYWLRDEDRRSDQGLDSPAQHVMGSR